MAFQNRRPIKPTECPWCDEAMIPCPQQPGRLCCPNDEPVEYRLRGGRWYFEGRLLRLDEPIPPRPESESEAEAESAAETPPDPRNILDEAERVAREKWGDKDD